MRNPSARTAIVTGSSRGIGAAVAERLAKDRFAVMVNYAGEAALAEDLVRKIEASGGNAISVRPDVSDPAAMRSMFDVVESSFGGVDVLVNNAGIMQLSTVAEADDALLRPTNRHQSQGCVQRAEGGGEAAAQRRPDR